MSTKITVPHDNFETFKSYCTDAKISYDVEGFSADGIYIILHCLPSIANNINNLIKETT